MKTSFIILIFCTISVLGFGQKTRTVVSSDIGNILYKGIDNPMTAMIEKTSSEDVILHCNNGIIRNYENYRFSIYPDSIGEIKISIYKRARKDSIFLGTYSFRVKQLSPSIFIHCVDSNKVTSRLDKADKLNKNEILKFNGLVSLYNELMFHTAQIKITDYRVTIFRNDSVMYIKSFHQTAKFQDETIQQFQKLEKDDVVLIDKILGIMLMETIYYQPFEFIIE